MLITPSTLIFNTFSVTAAIVITLNHFPFELRRLNNIQYVSRNNCFCPGPVNPRIRVQVSAVAFFSNKDVQVNKHEREEGKIEL